MRLQLSVKDRLLRHRGMRNGRSSDLRRVLTAQHRRATTFVLVLLQIDAFRDSPISWISFSRCLRWAVKSEI